MNTAIIAIMLSLFMPDSFSETEGLPFKQKIEVYRNEEGDVIVFALQLKQPFLAEEFEKSNYLRLQPLDDKVLLTYPKETKFHQKHAAFYGRLKGEGKAKLRLSYEMVTENLDGSRKVDVCQSTIEIDIPGEEAGHENIYKEWAQHQNDHFLNLLNYYPGETFLQYCLLQSHDRYGIESPRLNRPSRKQDLETGLYGAFTGTLAIQEALQSHSYYTNSSPLDYDIHISRLSPPTIQSRDYKSYLEEQREKGISPDLLDISSLIPENQYLLYFNSMDAAEAMIDLASDWGDSLVRLFTTHAKHNRLHDKLETQLCLRRSGIARLFSAGAIQEMAVTGMDIFFFEGTDVTILFKVREPGVFEEEASKWFSGAREKRPDLVEREFNYHGHKVDTCYTDDRMVSSFVIHHDDYVIYSNSHVAIRKIADTINGDFPRLNDAEDYRYVSTLLPPSKEPDQGYFFASEEFVKGQSEASRKISEKRRVQCFNNLVMFNNASLMYRLEYGRSPDTLTDLIKERFADPYKLVCPHGGAYSFDTKHDTATCSLHNRIKYLTPNMELQVLEVSKEEREEYDRYKERYSGFWKKMFNPIAIRFDTSKPRTRFEICVLPFANGSLYSDLRDWLGEKPGPIETAGFSKSAVASVGLALGRDGIAEYIRDIPGIAKVLAANPTLTDLNWMGDCVTLNLCDGGSILEIDPTVLKPIDMMGRIPLSPQLLAGASLLAASLPTYITIEVTDRDKAEHFLQQLTSTIVLEKDTLMGLNTAFDAYRLPDYKDHAVFVANYRVYAVKVRFHMALVGGKLVAATNLQTLQEVIDTANPGTDRGKGRAAHLLFRFNAGALDQLNEKLRLYWEEKSRLACHGNIMSIYNLIKLYNIPVEEIPGLSQAKYGVTYYCPEGGRYLFDAERDQVLCSIHGNRQEARQNLGTGVESSFARFFNSLKEVQASLCYQEDYLQVLVELER